MRCQFFGSRHHLSRLRRCCRVGRQRRRKERKNKRRKERKKERRKEGRKEKRKEGKKEGRKKERKKESKKASARPFHGLQVATMVDNAIKARHSRYTAGLASGDDVVSYAHHRPFFRHQFVSVCRYNTPRSNWAHCHHRFRRVGLGAGEQMGLEWIIFILHWRLEGNVGGGEGGHSVRAPFFTK